MSAKPDTQLRSIVIRVYHTNGAAGQRERNLVRTLQIPTQSLKPLNSRRAAQILARAFPLFGSEARNVRVMQTTEGWSASRALEPTAGCTYHYVWEEAVVIGDWQ